MESLPALGRGIFDVIQPTYQIYGDILGQPANASLINQVKRETFSYGNHHRQKLDLYTPSPSAPNPEPGKSRPTLVFVCGGAFEHGDRIISDISGGLVYRNLGYFFAEKLGFETVVIDYLLMDHGARFPSGGVDIGSAMKWVEDHYGRSDEKKTVILMGNSAGGVHVCTWLFDETFRQDRENLIDGSKATKLGGVILLGAAFNWNASTGGLQEVLIRYYGDEKGIKANEPTALMERARKDQSATEKNNWPELLILVSELDPKEMIIESATDFAYKWQKEGGKVQFHILEGHNHISPPLSLGTNIDKEEDWGFQIGRWIATKSS